MAHLDIFSGDAFSCIEMTAALNKVPYVPSYLGSKNIFVPKSIRTETADFEMVEGVISLVQTSERGAPLAQRANEKRTLRSQRTFRVAKGSKLRASELQNIRAFGSESELQQVQAEAMARMVALRRDVDLTHENMRLGALQGILLDADGSTLVNWFTFWGVSQPAEIDFDLDNASPASGALKKLCNQVMRTMQKASKGAWTPGTYVEGLCGDAFYDDLTSHPEVRATYLNQQAANSLREDYANVYESFRYGGINWVNYRGTDDGSTVAVGTDKVKFYPAGSLEAFQHISSPGESFDFVNTPGQPFYAMQIPDKDRNQHVDLEVYSYPLFAATRPEMLLRGKRT